MTMLAKPALAFIRGCRLCGAIQPGMLLLQSGAMLCRPCASKISAFLRRASPTFLNELWVDIPTVAPKYAPDEDATRAAQDDGGLVAEFRAGVQAVLRVEDFRAHWDLAAAYDEMGLRADAISEFATSLEERAPDDMAQEAFGILFGPPRAVAGALDRVVVAFERDRR